MRNLLSIFIALFLASVTYDTYGQLNRRSIKKNNKRISHFRGKKSHFGKEKIYNAVGFSLNALNYYGDLAPRPSKFSTDISFTRPAIGISFAHRFGPRYTLSGTFMYGTLRGADGRSADPNDDSGAARYKRNLSFRNRIKELTVVAMLDLFENQATYISRVKWTPYAFAGLSVFHHNPQGQAPATEVDGVTPLADAGRWVNLQPLGTEGQHAALLPTDANYGTKPYKRIQPAIPFGIGFRFRINEVMDVAAELGFRYLFTDYIDDVSKNYVDLGIFGNDELAKAMSYRTFELPEFTPANPANLPPTGVLHAYTGRDGQTYNVLGGYGEEYNVNGITNLRGNRNDLDTYMVTTIKLTYILGKTFHRAKFR